MNYKLLLKHLNAFHETLLLDLIIIDVINGKILGKAELCMYNSLNITLTSLLILHSYIKYEINKEEVYKASLLYKKKTLNSLIKSGRKKIASQL